MSAARPLRGWHVLVIMLCFFGTVIAVNAAFIALAVQSFPGEDVRRSYLQGLQYNDKIAERREQAALGWQAAAALSGEGDGALLEVTLTGRENVPLDGAAVTGELQWPTDASLDRALVFEPAGAGRYVARLDDLPNGRWRLRARAERGESTLDFEAELTWRSR